MGDPNRGMIVRTLLLRRGVGPALCIYSTWQVSVHRLLHCTNLSRFKVSESFLSRRILIIRMSEETKDNPAVEAKVRT